MPKKTPYFIEIGLGLILTGLVAWSYRTHTPLTETISLKTYDLLSTHRKFKANSGDIRIVEIDDNSVANLGRWPWPRAMQAQLIDELVAAGSKVIGLNILYADPDQNQGLEEISELQTKYKALLASSKPVFKKKGVRIGDFEKFQDEMETAASNLNGDAILDQSIEEAGNVVLPMFFQPGDTLGNNLEALPKFFDSERLALKAQSAMNIPAGSAADTPLENFGNSAVATGHTNLMPDADGAIRRIAPAMRYGKDFFPSFGLQVVREYLNLPRDAFNFKEGTGFSLGKANIPVDGQANAFIEFAGPAGTYQRVSAVDALTGAIPEGALKKKIVLVGVTATGGAQTYVGPRGERYTGLEIWANHIENILSQRFIVRPPWATIFEWGSIALAALIVIFALPLLKARIAVPVSALIFAGLLGGSGYLFVVKGMWVSPAYGALLLASGFVVMVGKRLVFTERGKEMVEAEGMETNKMLGLSFQGQGMLDLAFEKFRKCSIDNSMKELLYNLGLDMERKRMFAKAAAVYEHIALEDSKYKDIQQKIELLKKASDGAMFGSIGKKGSDATVVVDGLGQFTTLGRYEVQKELGRGAMGIVYLGKDPKINRSVAIKTLRFEDDMDEDQTKSVKERFFREAESAGSLTHPNIIRIFDAGEDQEVAYIAMELLDGIDLKRHCEKSNLFPMPRALDIVTQIADALEYAHKQGVVHRDIKPANIMLLKDETLRITDFGIARIQATSKTATGAVLGTPAYMSPEQVNGKKVDGRADIFSLGVTLFELLTGEKPFQADSIAALLYRIANVDHPDPREYNSQIPEDVVNVIKKALAKDPDARYQRAGEMADDLRAAQKKLSDSPAPSFPAIAEDPFKSSAPEEKSELSNDFMSELEDTFNVNEPVVPKTKTLESTMIDDRTQPFIEPTSTKEPAPDANLPVIEGLQQNDFDQSAKPTDKPA